ncbi:kelch-like protein 28 [Halichondria panicea]|uniref:kelch-like protein 28 n=1 Tax=Halichondria panicea TaxID=6063 RepID=UPI00312B324B
MGVFDLPLAINEKLYMNGGSNTSTVTVLVYTPDQDSWDELSPPPVDRFTVATLRGRLLVAGGKDKSTSRKTNIILTFNESPRQWVQSLPPMPKVLTFPGVVVYQNHLIIIGGYDLTGANIADVKILGTNNKWITAKRLPRTRDNYITCIIGNIMYIVGQTTKKVFRIHLPSLISRASSGVWESVASVPFYWSSPIAIGNTLLAVGGSVSGEHGSNAISSIHLYDPTKNQWTQCGDLPEKMCTCYCIELSGKLYVLGGRRGGVTNSKSVYTYSNPIITQ